MSKMTIVKYNYVLKFPSPNRKLSGKSLVMYLMIPLAVNNVYVYMYVHANQ